MEQLTNNNILELIYKSLRSEQKVKLHDIKSKRARNLIRGVDASNYRKTKLALKKIKRYSDQSDYKLANLLVRTSKKFEGNRIGQLLNSFCPKEYSEIIYYSPNDIEIYINEFSEELCKIAECFHEILLLLKNRKIEDALVKCNDIIDLKGVSIFLFRVLGFITNRVQLLDYNKELLKKIEGIKKKIGMSDSFIVDQAIKQLSNLRTSHIVICKQISELDNTSPFSVIIKSFINPVPKTSEEYKTTLSSYFSFSLFDAFLYMQRVDTKHPSYINNSSLFSSLKKCYKNLSEVEFEPKDIYQTIDEDTAYHYLRECFLFIEQPRSLNFQIIHSYYYSDFLSNKNHIPSTKKLVSEYFRDVNSLDQLRVDFSGNFSINWKSYDPSKCGMLENSSALIYLLEKKQGHLKKEEQEVFVKLMSFTRDIGEICKSEYLEELSNSAITDELKLVAICLRTIKNKSNYTEHQLRSILQSYCINSFNGDLIELLRYLYNLSPSVTEHLLLTCNEKFLSTLFHLMDKPVDSLNVRAGMLEWFGKHTGEERYIDRAKTLRIDIQIHREKGTIDDSRIYVDPLKYTQWFEDNIANKLTLYLDNVELVELSHIKVDWINKGKGVSNADVIIQTLLTCYREFCENSSFGIASYLGRRIRHGTFEGTASTELHKLAEKEEYKHLFLEYDFKREFEKWLNEYDKMIEELKKSYLHIKSRRKPQGIFTAEIDSPLKRQVANQLLQEVLSEYTKRRGVVLLPGLILDYCWRLVEHDLVETKKLLSEKKSTFAVFKYAHGRSSQKLKREISKFTQDVNALTNQKFARMASWFNKPNYASPSTDIYLLFNAVISEVKDSVQDFAPIIDFGEKSFTVNGGTYYVIYDALYVLIQNAAKHGKKDGKIIFNVSKPSERNAIKIDLMTELGTLEALDYASERINEELKKYDENAYVIESNSGIKKLKRLEDEGSISDVTFRPIKDCLMAQFVFYFELSTRGKYDDPDS